MPRTNRLRIAIVDDSMLVREALSLVLGGFADLRVVYAEPAVSAKLLAEPADILLLDVGLGDRDSLEVAEELHRAAPQMRIILMDLLPMHEDIRDYVSAGVAAFVLKDASTEEFVRTIRLVATGALVLPREMTESLFSQIVRGADGSGRAVARAEARLTQRELEVIAIIGEGLSNKEIAYRLNIATQTVKSHVRNVMDKLALHTRLQIAAYTHRERARASESDTNRNDANGSDANPPLPR